jgi:hypothetical protein
VNWEGDERVRKASLPDSCDIGAGLVRPRCLEGVEWSCEQLPGVE